MKENEEYVDEFSPRQELANIIIHVLGILFGLIAVPFLIKLAAHQNDASRMLSISIYGLSFVTLFTCSTLYHSVRKYKLKSLLKKFDRISIYFLISGTYTPIISYYLF